MPSENRSVGVTICRECTQVHDMLYAVTSGRIDQGFALHKHVHRIASYQKDSSDVFQTLDRKFVIIEIDKARRSKLICKLFQIRFPS